MSDEDKRELNLKNKIIEEFINEIEDLRDKRVELEEQLLHMEDFVDRLMSVKNSYEAFIEKHRLNGDFEEHLLEEQLKDENEEDND